MRKIYYLLIFLFFVPNAFAQSPNDILNVLVSKGTISQQEADSLKADATQKQQEPEAKKKSFTINSSKAFQLGGYTQLRYQILDKQGDKDGFDVRRVRLNLKGSLSSSWDYGILFDVAGSPKLIDAFGEWKIKDYFNITLGQFKIPFSLENYASDIKLDFIDRSQVVEALMARGKDVHGNFNGRDIGLQVGGSFLKKGEKYIVDYKIGVFNGEGINLAKPDSNEIKDVSCRLVVHPLKGLDIGSSVYSGMGTFGFPSGTHVRNRWGIEANYEYKNFSISGEYIEGKDWNIKKTGYYSQIGYYVIPRKLQMVLKYDSYDKDLDESENISTHYIVAANYTFNPSVRLQSAYYFKEEEGKSDNNNMLAFQLQLSF